MATLIRRHRGAIRPWDLQEEFSRMFNDFGGRFPFSEEEYSPALDIHETDDAYIVEVDIPGMKKGEVELEVTDDVLTVKGERKSNREEKGKNVHRIERRSGSFRRTVPIPGAYNRDAIEAEFQDGVLRITLPKLEESRPRKIEVKGN